MYTFGGSNSTEEPTQRRLQFGGALCDPNILMIAEREDLTSFVSLVELAGLSDIFLCAGPFTAWIPTNAAFASLDPNLVEFLTDPVNRDLLQQVLLYHLLPGFILTTELTPSAIQTIQGENVVVSINPVTINQAFVVNPDILACNGVIDIIDGVLLPPSFPVIGK
jgi:uncharacterized surface protein with fasciclin (FAS1) repeats